MATVAIPLIASAIEALGPLLAGAIQRVEAASQPRTGQTKLQTVLNIFKALLTPLATAGNIPGVPTDNELIASIEAVLAQLKLTNQLPPAGSSLPGAAPIVQPSISSQSGNIMTIPVSISWQVKS